MKDALAAVVRTSLDMHFGRLAPLPSEDEARSALAQAALTLVRDVSEHLLHQVGNGAADAAVLRHVLRPEAALPGWLVNKGLVVCENDRSVLEKAVCGVLRHGFHRRRFLDYVSGELLHSCWRWTPADEREHWLVRRVADASENEYSVALNTYDYVLKFDGAMFTRSLEDEKVLAWYVRSVGSAVLVPMVGKPLFEFTARLIEARYKTPFIMTLFRNLFTAASQGRPLDRYGVLVIGDVPKAFALRDYYRAAQACAPEGLPEDIGVLDLFARVLCNFDNPSARRYPEARFRIAGEPPQALLNRIGAMFWLRRTLDAAKAIQQKKAAPTRGLRVEELTVLTEALKQKSILYFRLFDDPNDSAINPCHLKAVREQAMLVQSPRGNRLNEARIGQEVHGYFSITGGNRKSTYLDFRSNVLSVETGDSTFCLVELSLPAAFELTRRSHKRLPLDPSLLACFELASPPMGADWSTFTTMEKWPSPFCIIPDSAADCHIRDLSAGGLMLEINQDAPSYEYFNDHNKMYPLLGFLHLVARANIPDLKLGLRLEVKRIRDFPPLRKKYVGFQFVEAGEVRQDRFVRFSPVGKDGVYLVNDWIFRNSLGR